MTGKPPSKFKTPPISLNSGPKQVGNTAVKRPKAKKMPGALDKPSVFFKTEESEFKKPSIGKLKAFLDNSKSRQSVLGKNEVQMSNDKKYTAQEAAAAVLAKAQEMLLSKAHEDRSKMSGKTGMVRGTTEANQNQKGVNQMGNNGSSGGMSEAGNNVRNASFEKHPEKSIANAKQIHKETLSEMRTMPKPALTKDEPPTNVTSQTPAEVKKDSLPATSANDGNPAPSGKGTYKLAKFCGHMEAKKGSK